MPPGGRSWSKALVRQGADPRAALAEVLGVSAGIFVSGIAEWADPPAAPEPEGTPQDLARTSSTYYTSLATIGVRSLAQGVLPTQRGIGKPQNRQLNPA
jgi:hypothetical protein